MSCPKDSPTRDVVFHPSCPHSPTNTRSYPPPQLFLTHPLHKGGVAQCVHYLSGSQDPQSRTYKGPRGTCWTIGPLVSAAQLPAVICEPLHNL